MKILQKKMIINTLVVSAAVCLLKAQTINTIIGGTNVSLDIANKRVLSINPTNLASKISTNGTTTYDGTGAGELGNSNVYIGYYTGSASTANTSTTTAVGAFSANKNTNNQFTAYGYAAGTNLTNGFNDAYFGLNAGLYQITGSGNTYIGSWTGFYNQYGTNNTFLGQQSGFNVKGSGNLMLGFSAGYNETGSNKLYIANSGTATPLVYGDFSSSQLKLNGKVGIGLYTSNIPTTAGGVSVANYNLFVNGGILTDEIRARLSSTWADYVFSDNYKLKPLSEVETFIKEYKHLPNVPSAQQIANEGIELGNMARIQQEKIEELTLYIIEQNKRIEKLESLVETLTHKK